MKKSFVLYTDQIEVIKQLTDEQAGILLKAFFDFNSGIEVKLDSFTNIIFTPFKQCFLRDTDKWNNIVKRNKANIGKRWNTKNTTGKTGIPKALDSVSVSDTVSVSDISKREKFMKYLEHLKEDPEFTDKNINLELKKFKDYLLANGKKYKDYCAAFRNWLRRSGDFTFKKQETKGDNERMLEKLNATRG